MTRLLLTCAVLATLALGACVPRQGPPQPPAPAPVRPAPTPAPAPPPAPPPADWRDAPLSPGDWTGTGESASYGIAGGPSFILRCDAPGRISLARTGSSGGATITIRTTETVRRLPAAPRGSELVATLPASDQLLDQIAFSRGRILVESEGAPPLIVPSWPEPARVTEECRGQ